MFSSGRRVWLVGFVVAVGAAAVPAFGDVGASSFSPVVGDDVLLGQARESLTANQPQASSGPALNPTQFSDLTDAEALVIAHREFTPDLVGALWSPPVLPTGSHIAGYASDSTALVDGVNGRTLLTSLLPLRSPDGSSGAKTPVSTTLESSDGGYEPVNALTPLEIPQDLGDGVSLQRVGITVTPVGVESADGRRVGGDKVFFANSTTDTDVVVGALPDGVETFSQIRSTDSPDEQGLKFELPPGASLEKSPDGPGEVIERDGVVLARVSPASAVDANGVNVPVSEVVHGDTVSIRVDDTNTRVQYPILLDPTVTVDSRLWDTGTSGTSLVGWEYKTTNINAFSSSTSGAWGRGLYSLVHAGMINATDAGEWRYTAPGDARIFSFGLGQTGKTAMRIPNVANGFVPICTSQGIRAAGIYGPWEPGSNWQSGTTTGTGPRTVCQGPTTNETPIFCAAANCTDTGGSATNAAINNQWAYGAGKRLLYNNDIFGISEYDFIGAAYLSIADDKPPLDDVSTSPDWPSGWTKHYEGDITVKANDTGTGIWKVSLSGDPASSGPDSANQEQGIYCDGSRTAPCPAAWNSQSAWPYTKTFHINTDKLPEGDNALRLTVTDRTGNVSLEQLVHIKVDRTPPTVTIGGSLPEAKDEDLLTPDETLSIRADDLLESGRAGSGVAQAEVLVDGNPASSVPAVPLAPSSTDPLSLDAMMVISTDAVALGQHTITVRVTDRTEPQLTANVSVTSFTVTKRESVQASDTDLTFPTDLFQFDESPSDCSSSDHSWVITATSNASCLESQVALDSFLMGAGAGCTLADQTSSTDVLVCTTAGGGAFAASRSYTARSFLGVRAVGRVVAAVLELARGAFAKCQVIASWVTDCKSLVRGVIRLGTKRFLGVSLADALAALVTGRYCSVDNFYRHVWKPLYASSIANGWGGALIAPPLPGYVRTAVRFVCMVI